MAGGHSIDPQGQRGPAQRAVGREAHTEQRGLRQAAATGQHPGHLDHGRDHLGRVGKVGVHLEEEGIVPFQPPLEASDIGSSQAALPFPMEGMDPGVVSSHAGGQEARQHDVETDGRRRLRCACKRSPESFRLMPPL